MSIKPEVEHQKCCYTSVSDAVATKLPRETQARTLGITTAIFAVDDVAARLRVRWR